MSSGLIRQDVPGRPPPREGTGINTRPGSDDDGYTPPPAVSLADGTRVQLHKDGEALRVAYDAIAAARRRVCVEFYIFSPDATGTAFLDLLTRKLREGCEVWIIYDSFGSLDTIERFDELARLGAHVGEFHPVQPWRLRFGWRPFNRDHRKLVVVDDEVAVVGGLNIADSYAGKWVSREVNLSPDKLWRDTGVCIRGRGARMFQRSFAKTWNYILHGGPIARAEHVENIDLSRPLKGRRFGKHSRYLQDEWNRGAFDPEAHPTQDDMGVMAHVPTLASPLRPLLYRLLRSARRSVQMTVAYFAPDDELIRHLCDAARRGVCVQLMLAARSDMSIMVYAARAFYHTLLSGGVEIYERQSVVLHAKTLCIDGDVSIVGSTNLDYRSIEFNCELSALIRSREFGGHMHALFDHDRGFAKQVDRETLRRWPTGDRVVQWMCSRSRYLL
jgi:cardiolipin synthase